MKVLFAGLHLAYFRNFDSVIVELARRGHRVHLTGDETEAMGGQQLAERLAAGHDGVTWDLLPSLESEPWFDAARRMRVALDYVRALEPRYPRKLRLRAEVRTARVVRWAIRTFGWRLTRAALTRFERLMPASETMIDYLRGHAPDVVVLTALTYSRSQQLDVLKAARALDLPVAAAIMSWDHLSSKALIHVQPDQVIVWNDVQRDEAVSMHGVPADRIVATGAQCYDQWFTRVPERSREEFCRAMGLRADRPFVLWVHSALSPTPEPPEPQLVVRWIEALRAHPDPRLRDAGVLVRPHPERLKEWAGIDLTRFEHVAFHGGNPIDRASRDDYFDSLYHSAAVVGLVTSAFLEAAVVGRPVLTFMLPEYRMHQEEMIHFQYLLTVEGGLLHTAAGLDEHFQQLGEALALGGARDERNRRFIGAFIRPAGLDVAATPRFADTVEALARAGARHDASLARGTWLRPLALTAASWSRTGAGRWLMNDRRADSWDDRARETERAVEARKQAKVEHYERKARRKASRRRQELVQAAGKKAKGIWRRTRHRAAVTVYRGLYAAGVRRGAAPGAGKE